MAYLASRISFPRHFICFVRKKLQNSCFIFYPEMNKCLIQRNPYVRKCKNVHPSYYLFIRVEWFSTFFRILKCTLNCGSGIFLRVQFQKIGDLGHARARHARQSFHFQKITGTLKINIFCENLQKPSTYSKEQLQKIKC